MATTKRRRRPQAGSALFEVSCDGIAIETEFTGAEGTALVSRIVERTLPGEWTIKWYGEGSRDYAVSPVRGSLAVGRAWDLVRKLRNDRDVVSAEPLLDMPGLEPPPSTATALGLRAAGAAAKSGGGAAALPCSNACDWSLAMCRIPEAWDHQLPSHGFGRSRGEGVVVAHPDTGYTKHHEIWPADGTDLRVLAELGFDFMQNKPDPVDPLTGSFPGHGTGTASVIMSAVGPSAAAFVSGAAPKAKIVPLRVSGSVIHFNFDNLTRAIYFAANSGFHVVSMSLGGPFGSGALHRAILYAIGKGVILLAAAGNRWPFVVYPGRYDEVVCVAASNCRKVPWSGSAAGRDVDVTAPGESVWRANARKGSVERGDGTSFSVATTAGVCALWLAYHGRDRLIQQYGAGRLAAVFKEVLVRKGVTKPPGWKTDQFGSGIVNALELLRAPLPATAPAGGAKAVHASVVPRRRSEFEQIAQWFPDQPRQRVRARVAQLLNVSEDELEQTLAVHGDELGLHAAIDPNIRRAISGTGVAKAAGAKRLTALADGGISTGLRQQIAGASKSTKKRGGR